MKQKSLKEIKKMEKPETPAEDVLEADNKEKELQKKLKDAKAIIKALEDKERTSIDKERSRLLTLLPEELRDECKELSPKELERLIKVSNLSKPKFLRDDEPSEPKIKAPTYLNRHTGKWEYR